VRTAGESVINEQHGRCVDCLCGGVHIETFRGEFTVIIVPGARMEQWPESLRSCTDYGAYNRVEGVFFPACCAWDRSNHWELIYASRGGKTFLMMS
jgi:hypothetical protein